MTYQHCTLCPRQCGVDRAAGQLGFCRCPDVALVAKVMLHHWEEPALAGAGGSGAIFFGGCTLGCKFCQNSAISHCPTGQAMDSLKLRQTMEDLIRQGAENIDLVTPTQFLPTLLPALEQSLSVPVVYNCGGYETPETIHSLSDNTLAKALSGISDYFEVATAAIREMVAQVGPVQYSGDKVTRGVIIRHLILPGNVENSLKVLDWIGDTFASGDVLVSLMRQYTPMGNLLAPMDRPITDEEYDSVLSWMYLNDLQGFTQEESSADTTFIPEF